MIPDYPQFMVSSAGRVYSVTQAHIVAPEGSGPTATVPLVDSVGRTHQRHLRRLVVTTFGHDPQEQVELKDPDVPPTTTTEPVVSVPSDGEDPDGVVTNIAWRSVTIPEVAPGYQVSELGEVISPLGTLLRPGMHGRKTDLWVSLARDTGKGKYLRARLDAIVALAFLDPPPNDSYTVHHVNGDDQDCRAENLAWVFDSTSSSASPKKKTPKPPPTTDDQVEVITTTVYRYGGVEVVSYPDGRWVHPPMSPDNAAALARILTEIGQRNAGK